MPAVLTRRVARAPGEAAAQWATAGAAEAGTAGARSGSPYALVPRLTGLPADTTLAVWLLGLALALQSFIELGAAVFAAHQAIERELVVRLVEKLVLVSVGFVGLGFGGGLAAVCGAFVLAGLVSLVLTLHVLHWRCRPPSRGRWTAGRARALAREVGLVSAWFLAAFATTRLVPLVGGAPPGRACGRLPGRGDPGGGRLPGAPGDGTAAVTRSCPGPEGRRPRFGDAGRQTVALLLLGALPVVPGPRAWPDPGSWPR